MLADMKWMPPKMRLIPTSAAASEKEWKLRENPCMASDVVENATSSEPKNAASTAAALLKVLWPDVYSGKGGVSSSGVQFASFSVTGFLSSSAFWIAVMGRQKLQANLQSQQRMAASASAMLSRAKRRAFSSRLSPRCAAKSRAMTFQCPGGAGHREARDLRPLREQRRRIAGSGRLPLSRPVFREGGDDGFGFIVNPRGEDDVRDPRAPLDSRILAGAFGEVGQRTIVSGIERGLLRGKEAAENDVRGSRCSGLRRGVGSGFAGDEVAFVRLRNAVDRVVDRGAQDRENARGFRRRRLAGLDGEERGFVPVGDEVGAGGGGGEEQSERGWLGDVRGLALADRREVGDVNGVGLRAGGAGAEPDDAHLVLRMVSSKLSGTAMVGGW